MRHDIPLVTKLVVLWLIANLGRDLPWLRQPNQIETLQIAFAGFFLLNGDILQISHKSGSFLGIFRNKWKSKALLLNLYGEQFQNRQAVALEWPLAHLFFPSVRVCFLTYHIASGIFHFPQSVHSDCPIRRCVSILSMLKIYGHQRKMSMRIFQSCEVERSICSVVKRDAGPVALETRRQSRNSTRSTRFSIDLRPTYFGQHVPRGSNKTALPTLFYYPVWIERRNKETSINSKRFEHKWQPRTLQNVMHLQAGKPVFGSFPIPSLRVV